MGLQTPIPIGKTAAKPISGSSILALTIRNSPPISPGSHCPSPALSNSGRERRSLGCSGPLPQPYWKAPPSPAEMAHSLPNSSYLPAQPLSAMPAVQPLPSPPVHETEMSKGGEDVLSHPTGSLLASRRQNVSLPAFSFPSPSQRSYNYNVNGSSSSLLTPPSGNDTLSPVESSNTSVNPGYWGSNTAHPSHGSSSYTYASGASSHPPYTAAPPLSGSPAYSARGILSPVSSATRSHPLSPNHSDSIPSAVPSPFDPPQFSANVPVTSGGPQHYNSGFSYSINQSNEAYPTPSSLPPPTPSTGYYSHPGSSYNFSGPMATPPRPHITSPLSHLHSLHSSTSLNHGGYSHATQRYLPVGLTTGVYTQHGQSMVNSLAPHLAAGGQLQHSHIHQHAAVPHQERPFRCDQCPQSFNRNHDLKRHKRIHLAVKPFPCPNCDKSFSRKDALKVSSQPSELSDILVR